MLVGKATPEDTSLHPMHYKWAYELYNQAVRNTWFPHEIPLGEDLKDWADMTEDERHGSRWHKMQPRRRCMQHLRPSQKS
jgi:ribonucleotide reductase beta subunit family protein with ferritin-like domain